jgi:uncharacterized protein
MTQRHPDDATRVQRHPERGAYDRATIDAILDEALVCHVGFVHEGRPVVIPTIHGHERERIYLHGSPLSRMLTTLADGVDLCLTVSVVDGLVLARSAFDHSLNYRSVVVFGRGQLVDDADEKLHALEVISEHVLPGRWADVRPPTARELAATSVLVLSSEQASAKVRSGPPGDDVRKPPLDTWAGVVPLALTAGTPEADRGTPSGTEVPSYLQGYRRRPGSA